MTNLKYKILQQIHNASPSNPIHKSDFYKRKGHILLYQRAITELLHEGLLKQTIGSDTLQISPKGIVALETEHARRQDTIRSDIRYWITTIIAIAALVISIIK